MILGQQGIDRQLIFNSESSKLNIEIVVFPKKETTHTSPFWEKNQMEWALIAGEKFLKIWEGIPLY